MASTPRSSEGGDQRSATKIVRMSVLVRATDVPVASRPEYLHEGLRAVLGPLHTKLTAVGLTADDGPGALFSSTARQLARHLDHFDVASGVRVGTATLDLLTVALAGRLDRGGELPADIPSGR